MGYLALLVPLASPLHNNLFWPADLSRTLCTKYSEQYTRTGLQRLLSATHRAYGQVPAHHGNS